MPSILMRPRPFHLVVLLATSVGGLYWSFLLSRLVEFDRRLSSSPRHPTAAPEFLR
jgi:hypothetical protein